VDGEGEIGIGLRVGVGQGSSFELFCGALEAMAERLFFIGISQLTKETTDFVGAMLSGPNDSQSGGAVETAGLNVLEEEAFELAAVRGPVGVNAATAAIKSGAGLGQLCACGLAFCGGRSQTWDFGF
jgi:hypothetical protein